MFRSREKVVCWSLKRYDHILLLLVIEMCCEELWLRYYLYGDCRLFPEKMQRRDTLFAVVDFEYFASIFYVLNWHFLGTPEQMTLQNTQKLPPTFTSLYRLFLRTTSAAVLHHPNSKRNLRRLWRPIFNTAASVIDQIQQDSPERQKLEHWFRIWNTRSTKSTYSPFPNLTLIYSG